MPTIHVLFAGHPIDQRHFQQEFYILKDSRNRDDPTLRWRTDTDPPSAAQGGIIVWMQNGDAGIRVAFLFPEWHLTIAGRDYPPVRYSNLFIDVPFTLAYAAYQYIVVDAPVFQRPPLPKPYVLAVEAADGTGRHRTWCFPIQAEHMGHALQQVFQHATQQGISLQAITAVSMLAPLP